MFFHSRYQLTSDKKQRFKSVIFIFIIICPKTINKLFRVSQTTFQQFNKVLKLISNRETPIQVLLHQGHSVGVFISSQRQGVYDISHSRNFGYFECFFGFRMPFENGPNFAKLYENFPAIFLCKSIQNSRYFEKFCDFLYQFFNDSSQTTYSTHSRETSRR